MLRACALEFKGSWENHLPFIEFAYDNNFQATIQMAPYEALYGRKYRAPLYWDEVSDSKLIGLEIIQEMKDLVRVIRDRMAAAQSRQKSYADTRRRGLSFEEGDWVNLKISPMNASSGLERHGSLAQDMSAHFR
ncbi:uncharacterized protein LOC121249432 [Juglans microcarpa x Juglans regia]|uniref:uncharacterized protein LOC121249432 n=1 Tax=Juglans microcarpa x Juglans regia TaxID=2249226 RepID=UPI001B7F3839|nr:uncharacterized protein LOC121249432 [Juglans microcarpa x Juglans regia]